MLTRDGYPPGVPCWVDTAQPDPAAAAGFYGGLFGWELEDRMPAGAPGRYLVARLHGYDVAAVGSQPEGAPPTPVWNTYVAVDSADNTAAKVKAAGGAVLAEPFDVVDAGRVGVCADPSGAVFGLWQAKDQKGAQLVNHSGTWNWSNLNTREPERSTAFYGAVFGWEAETVDLGGGGGSSAMWRVPGYGDFLETLEPGLRGRQAAAGVPEGFADAIGWMAPMTSDQFADDVPPHWSVTFAADDTDAITNRAVELGGKVLTPPVATGVVKTAVLADPQGAVFSVNTYDPNQ
jgi:uncharacterized protein